MLRYIEFLTLESSLRLLMPQGFASRALRLYFGYELMQCKQHDKVTIINHEILLAVSPYKDFRLLFFMSKKQTTLSQLKSVISPLCCLSIFFQTNKHEKFTNICAHEQMVNQRNIRKQRVNSSGTLVARITQIPLLNLNAQIFENTKTLTSNGTHHYIVQLIAPGRSHQ